MAFHHAVEKMMYAAHNQRHGGAEAGAAGSVSRADAVGTGHGGLFLAAGHLTQELVHVGIGVALRTGVAGRFHARGTAQDIYLQTGIVRETIQPGLFINIVCLLLGVGT